MVLLYQWFDGIDLCNALLGGREAPAAYGTKSFENVKYGVL